MVLVPPHLIGGFSCVCPSPGLQRGQTGLMARPQGNRRRRDRLHPKALPQRVRPTVWQIPHLAWTMARVDAPGGWRLIALFSALLNYDPLLVGAHTVGEVASLDARAVMILRPNERRTLSAVS